MKKKILIIVVIVMCLFITMGIIAWNNRIISTITLDINPSIEIGLDKNGKVKRVIALNKDAKEIVGNDLKGKKLDDGINILTTNLINKDYAYDEFITILLYSTGNIESSEVENLIRKNFDEKGIQADIIVIDNVTKEDKKLAKKNNISLAKAAYINLVVDNNKNIDVDILIDKSIGELAETKNTGNYCDKDYILEGDFCLKEISRSKADNGMVCPRGYYEYDGVCYEEVRFEENDNLICPNEFTLKDNMCSRTVKINAEAIKYTCDSGEAKTRAEAHLTNYNDGDANDIVCVDYSLATHPVTPCELPADDPTERMSYGGKCYWHRAPVLPEGCPGSIQVNGECWQDATNIYICQGYRDGKQYQSKDEYCEHSIKYSSPVVSEYKCPKDYTLNGSECLKEETEKAMYERYCPSGYSLVDSDRCINYDKKLDKVDGYVCEGENVRLKGNYCVTYEIVEAMHS